MNHYKCGICGKPGVNSRSHPHNSPNIVGAHSHPATVATKTSPLMSAPGALGSPSVSTAAKLYETVASPAKETTLQTADDGTLFHSTARKIANIVAFQDHKYNGVHCDWTKTYSCGGSGDCGGVCRCGVIDAAWVTDVDTGYLADYILDETRRMAAGGIDMNRSYHHDRAQGAKKADQQGIPRFTPVDHAALERILVHKVRAYDNEEWSISTIRGYYGDEVDEIKLANPRKLEAAIVAYLNADANERVGQALEAEYGANYPAHARLEGKTFAVDTIPLDKIHVGNPDYQVRKGAKYTPADTAGVLFEEDGQYQLLDGHHRLDALQREEATTAKFIIAR